MKRNLTVTRSFRISESVIKKLQDDSRRRGVSINTLLNQVLLTYERFDSPMKRFGLVKITVPTFKRILEVGTEKAIDEAGKVSGESLPLALFHTRSGGVSLETVLDYLRDTGDFSDFFEYSERSYDGTRTITLSHQLGANGSAFLRGYAESLLLSVGTNAHIKSSADAVVIQIH